MINKIIRNFIAKQVAGRTDDGIMITLRDPQKVEFQTAMMQDLLMRRGIDPNAIQSEAQLKMIINQIKAMEKAEDAAQSGIRNTESAKVFNIEGQQLDPNKPIMGGTQTGKELSPELSERLRGTNVDRIKQKIADKKIDDDLPPPGSRGGDEDIAAPVQSSEETLKNMIQAENKKNIAAMKQRKMLDEAIDNVSPSLTGDRKYDADVVAADLAERMGKVYDDMPTKERLDLYDQAYTALTKKKFDSPEDFAKGGIARIGFGGGSDMGTVADSKGNVGPSKGGYQGGGTGPVERPSGGGGGNNDTNYDYTIPKEIAKTVAINTGKTYAKNKAIEKLGLGGIFGMAPQVAAVLGIINSVRNPQINEEDMQFATGGRVGLKGGTGITDRLVSLLGGKNMAAGELGLEGLNQIYHLLQMPGLYAKGGRIGLKDGMNRRTFLKLLGGLASIPIVGKIIKPLKTVKGVKNVPIIKTDNVPGKPEWFDQLVNKVILEGEDVTKKLATVEREIVHTKKINNTDEVTVYQDLNTDSVRVEYRSPDNMMEEPVDLSYKRTPPDEGSPQASSEFEVTESGFVGRADGPDDFFIDAEEVGGSSIKSLESDVSALKEYATGQKPTMKEFVQNKKRKDKVKKLNEGDLEAQSDYITARQGDGYDYDDYASGGIARMLGE